MPWDPVRDLLTMQERLESLFGHASPGWVPAVDLAELDDRYLVTVELPGLSRADVTIDYQDQVITIRGERPAKVPNGERYHQLERGQGPFSRSFRFGAPVAGDRVTADLHDGVLTVAVPKILDRRQSTLADKRPPMKRISLLALALLSLGFAGGLVIAGRLSVTSTSDAQARPSTPASSRQTVPLPTSSPLPDLSNVAESALKVAANISSTSVVHQEMPWPFWMDEGDQLSQSLGSGVVVRSDGLVLTNAHVIGDANADVRVTLNDGKERKAKLIGIDELTDLALLKVDATNLQTLPWGDSDKLRVAEWVLAIGNPFQLSGTVTLGIVSNVKRTQSGSFTDFVQTDAAINPGNSGGALINARGELIGINTMIVTETRGYQGIGLAIPSKTALNIMKELIDHGSVPWGSIGALTWMDAPTALQYYGIPNGKGLLVTQVWPNTAAARAGLRRGDWVLSFNGQQVADSDQLSQLIAHAKIGDRLPIEISRSGQRMTLNVIVESREQQQGPLRRGR